MAGSYSKKRKVEDGMRGKSRPTKKFKKQTDYYSESESEQENGGDAEDFKAVNLQDSEDEEAQAATAKLDDVSSEDEPQNDEPAIEEEITDASNSDSESDSNSDEDDENPNLIRKRKRNDPEAFATSMSKILGSKLSTSKRSDPVLSRSVNALQANKEMADAALEKKARHKLRDDKRAALEKGRVKDVLGASTAWDAQHGVEGAGISVQEIMEEEKRLRKTAQRGVVKMFNAVRAAQVKGEEAAREARMKGVVGQGRREERVNEMSKKGFLDLIAGSGGLKAGRIEEA